MKLKLLFLAGAAALGGLYLLKGHAAANSNSDPNNGLLYMPNGGMGPNLAAPTSGGSSGDSTAQTALTNSLAATLQGNAAGLTARNSDNAATVFATLAAMLPGGGTLHATYGTGTDQNTIDYALSVPHYDSSGNSVVTPGSHVSTLPHFATESDWLNYRPSDSGGLDENQIVARDLGYTGPFGSGGHVAWLDADPTGSRRAAYNQAISQGWTAAQTPDPADDLAAVGSHGWLTADIGGGVTRAQVHSVMSTLGYTGGYAAGENNAWLAANPAKNTIATATLAALKRAA